jgi:hypothetical protein
MAEWDRAAVLEILRDTKPEFRAWLARSGDMRRAMNTNDSRP